MPNEDHAHACRLRSPGSVIDHLSWRITTPRNHSATARDPALIFGPATSFESHWWSLGRPITGPPAVSVGELRVYPRVHPV